MAISKKLTKDKFKIYPVCNIQTMPNEPLIIAQQKSIVRTRPQSRDRLLLFCRRLIAIAITLFITVIFFDVLVSFQKGLERRQRLLEIEKSCLIQQNADIKAALTLKANAAGDFLYTTRQGLTYAEDSLYLPIYASKEPILAAKLSAINNRFYTVKQRQNLLAWARYSKRARHKR